MKQLVQARLQYIACGHSGACLPPSLQPAHFYKLFMKLFSDSLLKAGTESKVLYSWIIKWHISKNSAEHRIAIRIPNSEPVARPIHGLLKVLGSTEQQTYFIPVCPPALWRLEQAQQ